MRRSTAPLAKVVDQFYSQLAWVVTSECGKTAGGCLIVDLRVLAQKVPPKQISTELLSLHAESCAQQISVTTFNAAAAKLTELSTEVVVRDIDHAI